MNAFNRAENRDDLMGVLVKTIDYMDGNQFLVDHGVNLPDRSLKVVNHLVTKGSSLMMTLEKFKLLVVKTMQELSGNRYLAKRSFAVDVAQKKVATTPFGGSCVKDNSDFHKRSNVREMLKSHGVDLDNFKTVASSD